ncbi:hypothetical protein [Levilactobacillus mulengensis]|uniref:hypothetical protein n=1 Tax=Levilactobacillus mulengensis TaxID=2486025 RepID=UPI000F7A0F81|nr:hypothetical protein [Levilactobacillus mulengensis]
MKKLHWGVMVLVAVSLGLGGSTTAQAYGTYHQKSSALSVGRMRHVNNSRVHYVKAPKNYQHAKNTHGINTIKRSRGTAVTFKTKYLLPLPGYHNQAWGNPQGLTTNGRYLYVLYCPTAWHNRGRIVRYDMKKLNKLGLTPQQLQTAYTSNAKAQLASHAAVKVGQPFETGHGQSLAYNWKNHHLYMWCDREKSAATPVNQYGYIKQIKANTLTPRYQIRFRLKHKRFAVPGGHVLTFDKKGHAYFWSRPTTHQAYIYQGSISKHHVKFRLTRQVLKHGPGTHVQSMGYNPHTNRVYLVADDSIASVPVSKLSGKGHLTKNNVRWTKFSSKREFEGLTFTKGGHAYLLTNHNPEILRGNRVSW